MTEQEQKRFPNTIVRDSEDLLSQVFNEAFKKNKDFLVHQLALRFSLSGQPASSAEGDVNAESEWIVIDSLSKLRALVGGRFESLKARWQGAGFPLKRKKGDKISDYQVNDAGWVELESWIAKQGYLARCRPDKENCVFEILKN